MIEVIGIDVSASSTGVALPGGVCRTIKSNSDDIGARLFDIDCYFDRLLNKSGGADVAIIEAYAVPQKPRGYAPFRVAEAGGVIRKALYRYGIQFVEIAPASVKKWATANGHAQKQDMVKAAKNAGASVVNDDEADAWWLRKIGNTFYNMSPAQWSTLEKHQQELIQRVNWPKV